MPSKLTQLRGVNGDFARAYKYSWAIKAQSNATQLTAIMSKYSAANGLSIDQMLSAACVACELPEMGASEITTEIGMHTLRINGRSEKGGSATPEFVLSGDYTLYKFFKEWSRGAASSENDVQYANSKLLANITITSFNVEDVIKETTNMLNVWCSKCPTVPYSDGSNDIIKITPTLVFELIQEPK